jgi:hypothetical protein
VADAQACGDHVITHPGIGRQPDLRPLERTAVACLRLRKALFDKKRGIYGKRILDTSRHLEFRAIVGFGG